MRWFSVFLVATLLAASPARSEDLPAGPRVAIVQPGYPGSPRRARGFLQTLARHLEEKTTSKGLVATYHNLPGEALAALEKGGADVGVVSLGFYLRYRQRFGLKARLEASPEDCFYVVARQGDIPRASALAGEAVAGSPLYEPEFLKRLVFSGEGGAAEWKGTPTLRTTRALRELEGEKLRAVVLNGRQYRSLADLGRMKRLAKILESAYYPVALVVVFEGSRPKAQRGGGSSARAEELVRAFKSMSDDASGKTILETMGCEAFRDVRSRWLEKLEKRYDAYKKK